MIATLFVGYVFLLWQWRSPWILANESLRHALIRKYSDTYSESVSPDGSRRVQMDGSGELSIVDRNGNSLWSEQFDSLMKPPKFFCDEAFAVWFLPKFSDGFYHRRLEVFWHRHPEEWWGHFYRPEVWLLPLWLGVIIWTIRKDRGSRSTGKQLDGTQTTG